MRETAKACVSSENSLIKSQMFKVSSNDEAFSSCRNQLLSRPRHFDIRWAATQRREVGAAPLWHRNHWNHRNPFSPPHHHVISNQPANHRNICDVDYDKVPSDFSVPLPSCGLHEVTLPSRPLTNCWCWPSRTRNTSCAWWRHDLLSEREVMSCCTD